MISAIRAFVQLLLHITTLIPEVSLHHLDNLKLLALVNTYRGDTQRSLLGDFDCKQLLRFCFVDSTGTLIVLS